MVVNRTGRVLNVIDAVQPTRAIAIDAVAKALEQVNRVQCGAAGGPCGGERRAVTNGPPPIGGDEPGFLTVGDLPPAGPKVEPGSRRPGRAAEGRISKDRSAKA